MTPARSTQLVGAQHAGEGQPVAAAHDVGARRGRARRRPRRRAPRPGLRAWRRRRCRRTRRRRRPSGSRGRAARRAACRASWSRARAAPRSAAPTPARSARRSRGTATACLTCTSRRRRRCPSSITGNRENPVRRASSRRPRRESVRCDARQPRPRGHDVGGGVVGERQGAGEQGRRVALERALAGRAAHQARQLLGRAGAGRAPPSARCRSTRRMPLAVPFSSATTGLNTVVKPTGTG